MAASKPASLRARRNKTSTRATLRAVDNPEIPDLPDHLAWHPAVLDWWDDCWSSPMAPEWTESDRHALFLAARLIQQVWDEETSPASRVTSATEARHLLRECGLTPMARRSLQWEVDRGETAAERTAQRRATRKPSSAPDPRQAIRGA
ncbi:phage terminase small subunit [Nocardia sp. NPDC004260]